MDTSHVGHIIRSYQQEMFERSMEGNKIIVMDTGSGKTQVLAYLVNGRNSRLMCGLEQSFEFKQSSTHRVWFLAPTVDLCIQQHQQLSRALPAYNHRLLTGSDNVDRWSEQRIWDAALDQQRVIISTHAVLADALGHGFVRMSALALIVFDEAHHCVRKHPANVIMKDFYHPTQMAHGPSSVPHILGLSASVVTKSTTKSLQTIETNLNSISVTPRLHREDLLRHVHRPVCRLVRFDNLKEQNDLGISSSLNKLKALSGWLILPCAMRCSSLQNNSSSSECQIFGTAGMLQAAAHTVRTFCKKAEVMYNSLGSWAADYFVNQTVKILEKGKKDYQSLFTGQGTSRQTLLTLFEQFDLQCHHQNDLEPGDDNISSKVKCLMSYLLEKNADEPVGIVFVEQRATAGTLAALLQRHPATKDKFRCVPFVGTSNVSSRRYTLTELVDLKAQKDTLKNFRAGDFNLIVATNALEEGIDVQSCNVVACFDPPANLKSFIQRRGRARHSRSRLAVLVSVTGDQEMIDRWQSLEDELSHIYQRDRARTLHASTVENQDEEMDYELVVSSTGARMTADATLQHLHHFCNKLPHRPYVDFRPTFSYQEDSAGLIEATVVLPNAVSSHVRRATSQKRWQTERAAKKDAAFQAYLALHRAALLNDNLLPLCHEWTADQNEESNEHLVGLVDIPPQLNIWTQMGVDNTSMQWHETLVTVTPPEKLALEGETDVKISLTTPGPLRPVPPFPLHWASARTFSIKYGLSVPVLKPDDHRMKLLRDATLLFYTSVRSDRLASCSSDFMALFAPCCGKESLAKWLRRYSRKTEASSVVGTLPSSLVRVPLANNPPYICHGWSTSDDGKQDLVQCESLPRRRNFFSPTIPKASADAPMSLTGTQEPRLLTFPAGECTFDSLPLSLARMGLFMPAILQQLEDFAIADRVQSSILGRVPFKKREHLLTAIYAPSANRQTNYQRYEFLGDSVLKFVVSCHLFASQPDWHEGFLTLKRSNLVCNTTLARAAVRSGLSPYIISEPVSLKDWTIPTFTFAQTAPVNRNASYKMLADVVEALIGAAWLDAGISAARECINIFVPAIPSIPNNFTAVSAPGEIRFGPANEVESLIGYSFENKILLLEALTHPSYGGHWQTDSYQRLEYLGDAVLDMLVARHMATRLHHLSQGRMTQLKAALVNARLLGFLCLDLRCSDTHHAVQTDAAGQTMITKNTREVHLVQYMRATSTDLATALSASQERYALQRADIRRELDSGKQYPWIDLLRLVPEKVYSDLIESVLGAIFVDAKGSLLPCMAFMERLGLQTYMERLIDEVVDVAHPRERVQRFAGARSITYDVQRNEADGRFQCSLFMDKVKVTEVDGCYDREEAIARVASRVEGMLSSGKTVVSDF